MKKISFTIAFLLLISTFAKAQSSRNELKINVLGAVTGLPDLSYERLLNKSTSVGISLAKGIDGNHKTVFQQLAIPYYRLYFGRNEANGFFTEGNAAIAYGQERKPRHEPVNKETKFGLGLSVGYKVVTQRNFLVELNLGAGKYFNGNDVIDYPRIGISIGKRF
jgi:hypothetical protein